MYQTDLSCAVQSAPVPHSPGSPPPAPPACSSCGAAPARPSGTGKRALWWGLAGTLLSGLGWVALMLFDQYNAGLAELRNDLKHFHEARAELVTKERLRKLMDHVKDSYKELHAATLAREELQRQLKESERSRRAVSREVQRLRERLAAVEGRQAAMPVVVPMGGER
jgi:hypothetical protein